MFYELQQNLNETFATKMCLNYLFKEEKSFNHFLKSSDSSCVMGHDSSRSLILAAGIGTLALLETKL